VKLSDQLPLSLSVIGLALFMILVSTFTRTVSPNLLRYVPRVNSVTPQVVDGLLDANCNKTMIKGFVISKFPTDKFVHAKEQVEVDSSVAGGLCPEWQPRHGQDLYQ
jgi:hypothetical protein